MYEDSSRPQTSTFSSITGPLLASPNALGAAFVALNVLDAVQLGQEQAFELLDSAKRYRHPDHSLEADIAPGLQVGQVLVAMPIPSGSIFDQRPHLIHKIIINDPLFQGR